KETLMLEDFMRRYEHKGSWPMELGSKTNLKDALYKRLEQKMHLGEAIKRKRVIRYAIAASIVVCLGVFLGKTKNADHNNNAMMIASTSSTLDSLVLSDGTKVYLSNNSSVKYPKTFNGDSREVTLLKGSAYFDVARNKHSSFLVNSGEVTTKVLGTAFNVVKKDTLVKV